MVERQPHSDRSCSQYQPPTVNISMKLSITELECLAISCYCVGISKILSLRVQPPSLTHESSCSMLAFLFRVPHRSALLVVVQVGSFASGCRLPLLRHVDPPGITGHDRDTCVLVFSNLLHRRSTVPQCFARSSRTA